MFLNRSYSHMDVLTKASITIHVIEDVAIYKAQIFSSNGNIFGINDRETEIHLVVWKGLEDITSRFNDIVWRRFTSKESGYEEDLAWGDKYRNKTSFTLTREDINERAKIQVEVYGPVNGERKLVAVDYINFIDVNDLQGSQTPPSNPKDGELWLDTSVTPPRLMMWDAKLQMWVEITVAGKDRRNLIRNSNFYKATFDHWVTTNNPVIEIKSLNAKKWARLKARTGKDKICGIRQTISNVNTKSKYTFQMLSEVYIQSSAPEGNALVALYSIDKQNKKTLLKEELFDITTDARTYSSTFTTLESTEAVEVNIGGQKQVPFDFLVTDIKLANYPVATEWELAIEDIQDALNNKLENSHEEVFNSLTDNGQMQGMYVDIDEQGRKNFYFNASYIKSGKLLGEFIEGRNLTVKDNSGNKTLEITSNGEINIKAKSLSIGSSSVATNNYVNNAVENVQFGGRNLLWNSGFKKGITYWEVHACNNAAAITDSTALSGYAFKFTSTGDGGLYQRKSSGYYPSGTILTVSGYVKCSVAGKSFDVNFENAGSSNTFKRTTCTNKDTWYYFTYTYTVSWNTFNTVTFYGQTGADYYVKDLMLEYGNKASTWVEAPEDVNQDIEEVKTKTSEIKSSVDGITANVTTIKTQTDMSTNPMTLVAKPNFSAYETENEGEVFLHGLDNNRNPANVDGKCIWNNQLVVLPKVMFNPNKIVADGIPIYMVRNIADKKWWSIWKETDEAGTVSWKRVLANSSTDTTVYSHTWNEANDIVVGYYIIKKTEPRDSEAPISIAQLFNGALSYKQAQSMSLVSSISQFDILEDKIDLKVQKNNVISSINLYTQENENGTTSGVKIQGDKIDLQGQVTFSSLADNDVSGSIKDIFTQQNNKTVINGGMIQTQSIKGDDLLLKGNLTVSKTVDNKIVNTFAIKENGDIEIDGLLKSANFSESLNTGYKISTDGTAIFNQAQIKGDVILARAGMTNYGGPIGNENLIRNSNFTNALNYWTIHDLASKAGTSKSVSVLDGGDWCPPGMKVLQIRGTNTTDRYGVISQSFNLTAGVKYTISGYCAGHRITKLQVNVRNMDASSANIHTVNYNPVVGGTSLSKWTFFKTTFTASANAKHALNLYATAMQSDGYAWFADVKLEAGEVATPWCPHTLDQDGHVRIWAGSEYDKRDNAPFRVYQNGDIFATNGIFSGRVLGHIDSGNIHIDNGEFVINSTSTYMHNNKILSINKTRDIHPNPYIKFSSTENFINTDLSFGTINDKRLFYNNNNRELTSNISFIQNNSWGSIISNKDVVDGSTVKGFTIIDASNRDGGKHRIKYWKEYTGMIFESYGARHNPNNEQPYDFKFERLDGLVNVKVQGNIELTNSIQGSNQNIQLRSVANEGWGFFVI